MANWCVPMLTFSWSVVLPIGLLVIISIFSDGFRFCFLNFPPFRCQVLSVSSFKMGYFCDMFNWRMSEGYAYWPLWARQTGTMLQLIPILLIPTAGIIQCIRYLSSGPSDLFEVCFHIISCSVMFINCGKFRGSNCCTGLTSGPISSRMNRLLGRHPGHLVVNKEANGEDPADRDLVLVHHRPVRSHSPIRHPSTRLRQLTTRRPAQGNISNKFYLENFEINFSFLNQNC